MKILCLLLLLSPVAALAGENHLTLHFLPSPGRMDWNSPRSLAWTALKNRLSMRDRFMGHVFVDLKCSDKRELTGMRAGNFDYLNQLLWENRGLGVLFHSFEGRLESSSELAPEIEGLLKEGKVNFTRFLLNDGQCSRLTTYFREYRANKVDRYYGLANRPLYGEGAGCSAFAVSFLEVAEIMDEEMKDNWGNSINVPLELSGPPLRDEGINILKVMFSADSWALERETHRKLFFWDPDRMYHWTEEKLKGPLPARMKKLQLEKSLGLVLDMSEKPVPQKPIWRQHTDPTYQKK